MSEPKFENVSGRATITKAPAARKDYGVDLSTRLLPGETVDTSKITVSSKGVTAESPPFLSGSNLLAWVSGGDKTTSENWVELAFTTTAGRTDTFKLYFTIQEQSA